MESIFGHIECEFREVYAYSVYGKTLKDRKSRVRHPARRRRGGRYLKEVNHRDTEVTEIERGLGEEDGTSHGYSRILTDGIRMQRRWVACGRDGESSTGRMLSQKAQRFSTCHLALLPPGLLIPGFQLRDSFADFAPGGEVPGVGEAGALAGFDGLDAAVAAFEEDAGVVGGAVGVRGAINEGEAVALGAEDGEALDEVVLGKAEVGGDGGGLVGIDLDEAGPAAAMGAALALIMNFLGHGLRRSLTRFAGEVKTTPPNRL